MLEIFRFQIAFIEKCYTYITYHLEKPTFSSSQNIFIVGNKSAGKTTILHLLAEKLLHSHLAVYSECLYCSEWNSEFLSEIFLKFRSDILFNVFLMLNTLMLLSILWLLDSRLILGIVHGVSVRSLE